MCQGEEHLAETSGSAADTDGHSEAVTVKVRIHLKASLAIIM